ncbi:MAG: hypothetical protein ACP5HM_00795 [Anaerolineae bacterium]
MKRWLMIMGLCGSLLLLSMLSLGFGAPRLGRAGALPVSEAGAAAKASLHEQGLLAVSCTLEYTTTDQSPTGNHDFFTAATLAEYTGQSLVGDGTPSQLLETQPDFYRLDNASVGTQYTVRALPDKTTNYNLGIVVYDRNRNPIVTDTNAFDGHSASVTLGAENAGPYYFKVYQISDQCSGSTYHLELEQSSATPTPTPIPPPSDGLVEAEPNDDIGTANTLPLNQIIYGAIAGVYDQDFFSVQLQKGQRYRIILNDWGYSRRVEVYDSVGNFMDKTTTASGSAELTFTATDATHFIGIFKSQTASPAGTNVDYDLRIYQLQPTPTPTAAPTNTPAPGTPTPVPTWPSGYDDYEPNFSFETAQTIAPGVTYELNFMPWGGSIGSDNDFFKMWVKPGLQFTCETFDLGAVVDTNMILYDANRNLIGGNDDRVLGDYSSKVSYYSTYEGYLYVLVGTGDRLSYEDARNSPYKLKCTKHVPGTPTSEADDEEGNSKAPLPTSTPTSPSSPVATPTPLSPTPTPEGNGGENGEAVTLNIRLLSTPLPMTATPTPSGFRTFRLVIYYDVNDDGQFGAGEGVPGFFVRVLSISGGEELAHGYTDEQGQLSFSVPTVRAVRVVVPFLGLDRLIDPTTPEMKVRIAPLPLPETMP